MANKKTSKSVGGANAEGMATEKASRVVKAGTEDPRQRYERRLLERQKELEQDLARTVEQALASNVNDAQDVADQAVAGYQKEMLFSQGTVRNAQLRLVRAALSRIADGSFGDCVRCYQTIGAKRMEALPWTPYCIDCQERIEKGEVEASAVA